LDFSWNAKIQRDSSVSLYKEQNWNFTRDLHFCDARKGSMKTENDVLMGVSPAAADAGLEWYHISSDIQGHSLAASSKQSESDVSPRIRAQRRTQAPVFFALAFSEQTPNNFMCTHVSFDVGSE
jgi:hypothetical protein